MRNVGCLTVECLLLIADLAGHALAARTARQRAAPEQYVLPPLPFTGGDRPNERHRQDLGDLTFTLRHIYHHGTHKYPEVHVYKDIPPDEQLLVTYDDGETYEEAPKTLGVKTVSTDVQRLVDRRPEAVDRLLDHYYEHGHPTNLPSSAWAIDEIRGPNYTDKQTVLSFAKMAANAYVEHRESSDWQPVGGGFNYTADFGWRRDGLRGHVFADETNGTVVIGLKGTSPALFDGADTTGNDKLNDNLFGSCCCGQGGQAMWKQVCDCMTSAYTCNQTCLVKSLREKGHYYWAVRDLYHNVTERYPGADVWLSGHSLGGVVAAMLSLTFGLPTFTYEAYPDAMAASRLGLPTPPGYRIGAHQSRDLVAIHHFGHTADPIYMGTCNTFNSFCTLWGYAFEGVCHTGRTCQYDTVGDLGWRQGVGTHRINSVITDVIAKYDDVPKCEEDVDCQDCFNWKFYDSNGTETPTTSKTTTTTPSTVTTRTRTETCKTPGWWGCLDEPATTSPTTTMTSTLTQTTCLTPGWFGCNDGSTTITTTVTITSPSSIPASTTSKSWSKSYTSPSCKTPGWLGCEDPTSSPSTTRSLSKTVTTPLTSTSATTCTSAEWFGLICVDPSPTSTHSSTPTRPTKHPAKQKQCMERSWFGWCKRWDQNGLHYQIDL